MTIMRGPGSQYIFDTINFVNHKDTLTLGAHWPPLRQGGAGGGGGRRRRRGKKEHGQKVKHSRVLPLLLETEPETCKVKLASK